LFKERSRDSDARQKGQKGIREKEREKERERERERENGRPEEERTN